MRQLVDSISLDIVFARWHGDEESKVLSNAKALPKPHLRSPWRRYRQSSNEYGFRTSYPHGIPIQIRQMCNEVFVVQVSFLEGPTSADLTEQYQLPKVT
jgi:hypothetical protein